MQYEILGPLRVLDRGEELELGSRKQRVLLALLIVNAGRVVSTERIIDELWPDDPEGHENALWVYISRLRGVLEPERSGRGDNELLRTRDHGYLLAIPSESIDARRFERAVEEAARTAPDDDGAADLLRSAESEWRGRPLEDIDAGFALVEATRLEEIRVSALEDRFDLDLRGGGHGNLVAEIESATLQHPYRERLVGQIMLALYRGGRQAEALRTFERFRRTLGEDLGTDPSPELVRLEEQILLHDSRLQIRRARGVPSSSTALGRTDAENPFKGLRAFGENDANDFFGRDRLVGDVVRRIAEEAPLITLVGPSGSGKSSVLGAGVVPALRKAAIDGSDRWLVARMAPGSRPFAELEAALLRSSLDGPDSLIGQLRGEDGLLGATLRLLPDSGSRLVLVIDQFEELFTLVDDSAKRSEFLDALIPALDDPHKRVVVLVALRADLYDRPLAHPEFGRRMGDGVVNVVPLTPDELETAAVEPMNRAGCHIEPSLLVALLGDVAGQPGALPVFQYALTELYERRTGDMLTVDSYRRLGGVKGALAQRAEDLFSGLSDPEQLVARQLFLRLVTIGDSDDWARRRIAAREVLDLDVDVVALQNVIDRFGNHRLLSFDRDLVDGAPTVEMAHEALLTGWPRLHDWIAEARTDVRRRSSLGAAAAEWVAAGRNADYLFTGSRLDEYEAWSVTSALALTSLEQQFLDEAVGKREAAAKSDSERLARERELGRRARIRAWGLAAAMLLIATATTWLLLFAGGSDPLRVSRFQPGPLGEPFTQQFENGWDQAARELDLDFDDPLQPASDLIGQLVDLVETRPDLVLIDILGGNFGGPGSDLDEVVASHPDQLFALADQLVQSHPNLITFDYATNESSFLAGAAAALSSETGVVGFIGGTPALIDDFRAGFEAGARFARPDIEVLSTHLVGDGYEVFTIGIDVVAVTNSLIDQGADVIYHATGPPGDLVLAAAAARQGRHVWVIGVDGDQALSAGEAERDHVLTSALKRWDRGVLEILRRFAADRLEPGELTGDLASGAVGLVTPGNMTAAVIARVEEIRQSIIDGTLTVPDLPDRPPMEALGTDYAVPVAITSTGCTMDGPTPASGDVVRFEFDNGTDRTLGADVWKIIDGTPVDQITLRGLSSWEQSFSGGANTGVFVPGGSAGVLTVRFGEPGEWILRCFEDPSSEVVDTTLITVVEPEPTTDLDIRIDDSGPVSRACVADASGVRAGDAVEILVANESDVAVTVLAARVDQGTSSLRPDFPYKSGMVTLASLEVQPGGESRRIVVFDEPGTHVIACFPDGSPGDRQAPTFFEVAP